MLKVVGGVAAAYLILNTLGLAAIGVARCMEAEMKVYDSAPDLATLVSNGWNEVLDEAADTVKRWRKWVKE